VGASSADFWLHTGRMPIESPDEMPRRGEQELSDDDVNALVAYVASLDDGPEIPVVEPGDVQLGMTLYLGSCATCHSSATVGGAMPRGDFAPSLIPSTPTQIAQAIQLGPGNMPSFEHTFSDEEINAVTSYVVALRETQDHGGHSLGGHGPVVEGLVGWVLGLGVLLVVARLLGTRPV
jgi:ubiquinol-cytochrome c reductase cytochrome c subunit